MLVEKLKDQWICSCGNWVDKEFHWCPDCCEEKRTLIYEGRLKEESNMLSAH